MTTSTIIGRRDHVLTLDIKGKSPLVSLELHQTWPKAQHPHARRIAQLNMHPSEAAILAYTILQHLQHH